MIFNRQIIRKSLMLFLAIMIVLPSWLNALTPIVLANGINNQDESPWETLSTAGNETNELVEQNGDIYTRLGTGEGNNNAGDIAVFRERDSDVTADGSMSYTFIPETSGETTRFGLFTHYQDPDNHIFIGYDRSGWFYEYKIDGSGEWLTDRPDVDIPEPGNSYTIEIDYEGNELSAELDGEDLFGGKITLDESVEVLYSYPEALKLGRYGDEDSQTLIRNNGLSEESPVDMSELDELIAEIEALNEENYTEGSWEAFDREQLLAEIEAELEDLEEIDDPNVIQERVNDLVATVREQMGKLESVGVDKTELQALIAEAEELEETDYTAASWSNFSSALDAARVMNDNPGAEQAHVNQAVNNLRNSMDNLVAAEEERDPVEIHDADLEEGDLEIIQGDGTITYNEDGSATYHVTSTGKNKAVLANIPNIRNGSFEADITSDESLNRFGLIYRVQDEDAYTYVGSGDANDNYFGETFGPNNAWTSMTSGSPLGDGETVRLRVRFVNDMATLYIDDEVVNTWNLAGVQDAGQIGFEKSRGAADITISNITVVEEVTPDPPTTEPVINNISSDYMDVEIDEIFPRVVEYNVNGKTLVGQDTPSYGIRINGVVYYPDVTFEKVSDSEAEYTMTASNEYEGVDAEIVVSLKVDDNHVVYEFEQVTNQGNAQIEMVEFDQLNFVSVNETETDAEGKFANLSGDLNAPGDVLISVDSDMTDIDSSEGYYVGVVSNDELSAGVWSSSEVDGHYNLIANRYENGDGAKTLGIGSSAFHYHRSFMPEPSSNTPTVKIAIAKDINDDGVVDWQDGAIVYRDIIQEIPDWNEVNNQVGTRIAMNFGSQAQQPFLKTLDNIKKTALATDGLGQPVLLKGYGNEGHDSAHPDYGDVGEKMGGGEDLNLLIQEAEKYNAEIGVHINAQETYPEAKHFSEDLIEGINSHGWGWLDQGYVIDKIYDLASGERAGRLDELHEIAPGLGFVYLDVWYQDQWESNRVVEQFVERGLRVTTEFGTSIPNASTWTHWATDRNYGGTTSKGINSELLRFISNHQKDSWVLNWPEANNGEAGTADHPLLGGFELFGFEGWQSDKNFDNFIQHTFATNIPTKFLQKYYVMQWETVEGDPTKTNLEQEITLQDPSNDDEVVVTRKDSSRDRVITLNDQVVLDGNKYLLPWVEQDFETPTLDSEKLYHYNVDGGETTWTLPDEYDNASSMEVYQLTDQGRENGQVVDVIDNQITINAEPETPYVVVINDAEEIVVDEWSTGAHVYDTGFNTATIDDEYTEVIGDTDAIDVLRTSQTGSARQLSSGDYYLSIDSPTEYSSISREITDLNPGKDYVAEVYVENQSDARAYIEVTDAVEDVENFAIRSTQKNYVKADSHATNNGYNSKMQRMQVSFTADSETATLILSRDAGDGETKFDDIRVVEKSLHNDVSESVFEQDFETVAQGIYPFVIGNTEGVEDNRIHLAELHAPYTQKEWGDFKLIDDVIDGNWSVKINTGRPGLNYRTIPQHFYFEPEEMYEVSFDYQTTSETYRFISGDQEIDETNIDAVQGLTVNEELPSSTDTKRATFTVEGSENGQQYIGIFNDGNQNDINSHTGEGLFILDNLRIEKINVGELTLEVSDATIELGEEIDLSSLIVTARDSEGNQVIDDVVIYAGEFDHNTAGTYEISYTLSEDGFEPISATAYVTVEEEQIDLTPLLDLISQAEVLAQETGIYTEESLAVLNSAIDQAKQALETIETEEELADMINDLQEAINQLEIDKTDLANLVAEAGDLVASDYTEASWAVFTSALSHAEAILVDEQATRSEVDEAITILQAAIDGLVEVEDDPESIDDATLKVLVEVAEALDSADYTEESFADLVAALEAALAVLADEEAVQEEVDAAADALRLAIAGLERVETPDPAVDKTALAIAVEAAESLDSANYTEESYAALVEALEAALAVLADEEARQEEVDAATTALLLAIVDLVVDCDSSEDPKEDDEDEAPVVGDEDGDSDSLPTTATSIYNWLLVGCSLLLASVLILLVANRKRRSVE